MRNYIGLLSVLCVGPLIVRAGEKYKYRLLSPSAPADRHYQTAPADRHYQTSPADRQYQARISRQLDTRQSSAGPYLNKDSFFSSGFLEDLFGLGGPIEPTVSFQGKREITPGKHPHHFPTFFSPPQRSLPPPLPQRSLPPPPPPQRSLPPPPPPQRSLPPPRPQTFVASSPYLHQPSPYNSRKHYHQSLPPQNSHKPKPQTPYKYTVKGSSTHFVDNNDKKTPKLHTVQPSHGHFNPGSSSLQSSGQVYPDQPFPHKPEQKSAPRNYKVKSFVHDGGQQHQQQLQHPQHQQHQQQPPVFSSRVAQTVISTSNKPSMEEVLQHIDRTSQHRLDTTTKSLLDGRTFNSFDVTPNVIQQQQPQLKKDVFQIFQKVPEKFSLVKDINQNFPEMENLIESTTQGLQITEIDPNIFPDKQSELDQTPGKLVADEPVGNLRNVVVIQPEKKNAKSFSPASTADTSSSGLISQTTTRKSITSSLMKRRRIPERVLERKHLSSVERPARPQKTLSSVERPVRPQKTLKAKTKVRTGFTSFPYRDKSSKYNAKLMVEEEDSQISSPQSELVSLEDKQGMKEETLLKLLAIAGEEWMAPSGGEKPVRRRQTVKFSCPEAEGHFPSPERCDVYYQCVHRRATKLTCGPGLLWNTETGQCDWQDKVDCLPV